MGITRLKAWALILIFIILLFPATIFFLNRLNKNSRAYENSNPIGSINNRILTSKDALFINRQLLLREKTIENMINKGQIELLAKNLMTESEISSLHKKGIDVSKLEKRISDMKIDIEIEYLENLKQKKFVENYYGLTSGSTRYKILTDDNSRLEGYSALKINNGYIYKDYIIFFANNYTSAKKNKSFLASKKKYVFAVVLLNFSEDRSKDYATKVANFPQEIFGANPTSVQTYLMRQQELNQSEITGLVYDLYDKGAIKKSSMLSLCPFSNYKDEAISLLNNELKKNNSSAIPNADIFDFIIFMFPRNENCASVDEVTKQKLIWEGGYVDGSKYMYVNGYFEAYKLLILHEIGHFFGLRHSFSQNCIKNTVPDCLALNNCKSNCVDPQLETYGDYLDIMGGSGMMLGKYLFNTYNLQKLGWINDIRIKNILSYGDYYILSKLEKRTTNPYALKISDYSFEAYMKGENSRDPTNLASSVAVRTAKDNHSRLINTTPYFVPQDVNYTIYRDNDFVDRDLGWGIHYWGNEFVYDSVSKSNIEAAKVHYDKLRPVLVMIKIPLNIAAQSYKITLNKKILAPAVNTIITKPITIIDVPINADRRISVPTIGASGFVKYNNGYYYQYIWDEAISGISYQLEAEILDMSGSVIKSGMGNVTGSSNLVALEFP